MVESDGLENHYTCKGIRGSNPLASVITSLATVIPTAIIN